MVIEEKVEQFFDWIQTKCYPDHPNSGTIEEWVEVEKREKKKKLCYFICNDVNVWISVNIFQRLTNIVYWFKYRFVKEHKYHLIDTKLKPNYYEIDNRMLYGMFSMLVDYVEIELGHQDKWHNENKNLTYREYGLNHLAWAKDLVYDEESTKEHYPELYMTPTPQAETAKEVEHLYLWWMDIRPNRPDPWDYPRDERPENESAIEILGRHISDEERQHMDNASKLEQQYYEEDTEMLIRLIKIRQGLWT
jgi:hypothetical protein